MKRRLLSLVLALVLTLCLLPVTAFAAQPADTSDSCISVIKYFEGFSEYPYWDHSQYTVGYGTRCPDSMLSHYRTYGITEEEAVALLKSEINTAENAVLSMAKTHGLEFTQNQFDALVSFTYNVGQAWTRDTSNLITKAVIDGARGNDFIFALTRWCSAGGSVNAGLITRRLAEANMYLNGEYSTVVPSNYSYVLFSYTSSTYNGESMSVNIQGYDAAATDAVRPVGVRSGYRFLGWYTASSGGKWVSHLDATTKGMTLYPHWQSGEGSVSSGVIQGTAAKYERSTTGAVNVYTAPSTGASVAYTLDSGAAVSIVADYVDASGSKWGKLSDGKWLQLDKTNPVLTPAEDVTEEGTWVVVTGDKVSIRSGAGTDYSRVRYAYRGEQMLITEVKEVSGISWGKFSGGWICLDYTDYADRDEDTDADTTKTNATIKLSSGYLNVRAGAGSSYSVVDKLSNGTRVYVHEVVTSGGIKWGRINQGWVSMSYVVMDPVTEETPTEAPTEAPTQAPTEAPTEAPTQAPTEAPTQAPTEAPTEAPTQPPVEEGNKPIATGSVNISSGYLNVRSGPGSSYSVLTTLKKGAKVEVFETKTVSGTQWGRISEKGWVSMSYIKLDPTVSEGDKENTVQTGTVNTSSGSLNVRSGAGTNYAVVATLKKGAAVKIYETKKVGSTTWGRCDKGWVSMAYIKLTTVTEDKEETTEPVTKPESPAVTSGTRGGSVSISSGSLNVRSGAGTGYSRVGTLSAGEKITLTELKMVSGTPWGKCSKGWVCLDYVKLDAAAAGSLVLIDAYGLNIRSGAGTSYSRVGSYNKGETAIVLETKVVGSDTWAKSAKGWFSLDYAI